MVFNVVYVTCRLLRGAFVVWRCSQFYAMHKSPVFFLFRKLSSSVVIMSTVQDVQPRLHAARDLVPLRLSAPYIHLNRKYSMHRSTIHQYSLRIVLRNSFRDVSASQLEVFIM